VADETPSLFSRLFSDEERGISDRGLGSAPLPPGFKAYDEMPQIGVLRGGGPSNAEILEAGAAVEEVKEAWKADHPTWPFDLPLRNSSGFFFSEEEIKAGMFDWFGFVPGPIGLVATVMSLVNLVRQYATAGTQSNAPMWDIVAQIVVQIATAVLAKKLKAKEGKALLRAAFKRLGLDEIVASKTLALVKNIQEVANREFRRLVKTAPFRALSKSDQGTEWHAAVTAELKKLNAQDLKGTGFRMLFEEKLALGSGKHHPGPDIDVVLLYKRHRIARIEMKISLKAISPTRTQTYMIVNDALSLDLVELYMTPTALVLMPDMDNGYPILLDLRR
jgi:hypothetical protein